MKKWYMLLATVALAACSTVQAPVAPQSQAHAAPQRVIVGVDDNYPPYDFFDKQGHATGFDVDILKAIGEKQNLQFAFIPEHWDKIYDSLDKKKYTVALSGFAYSDERAQKYQVSNTYAYGQDTIATVQANKKTRLPQTLEDLKKRKVITLGNSPYVEELENVLGKGSRNIITADSSFGILDGLVKGKADSALTDKIVAKYYIKQSFPKANIVLTSKGEYFEPYPLVFLAHKDEAALMQKINAGLAQIIQDGTYRKIYKHWIGEEPPVLPAAK